jgi:hypothetical protein
MASLKAGRHRRYHHELEQHRRPQWVVWKTLALPSQAETQGWTAQRAVPAKCLLFVIEVDSEIGGRYNGLL